MWQGPALRVKRAQSKEEALALALARSAAPSPGTAGTAAPGPGAGGAECPGLASEAEARERALRNRDVSLSEEKCQLRKRKSC